MAFSRSRDAKRMGWLLARPIAHRGLHDGNRRVPENSLKAFARAMERRLPFELDVHLSREGEVVVFHDFTLKRMTGAAGRLADMTMAELGVLRLAGTQERVPSLEEVLDQTRGRVGILVELKTERGSDGRLERRVADLLATYRGPVAVQSFNPATVQWFRDHAPDLARGQLAMVYAGHGARRRTTMVDLARHRADFLGYHSADLPNRAVTAWRKLGVATLAWTIRSPRQNPPVDNIIFEGFSP